jgi:hypothetical protein
MALLHIERAHRGTGTWRDAHARVAAAVAHPVAAGPAASMAQGAPAVAFAMSCARFGAYQPALVRLDQHVTAITRHRLERASRRMNAGQLPELREFDLIGGLTGLGAYFLHRHSGGPVLPEILHYLIRLTEPAATPDGEVRPGWWTPNGPSDLPSPTWPGGHANHGIAHGIAGPLALLAATARRGVTVPGWQQAIQRICAWLARWQRGTPACPCWPEMISAAELRARRAPQPGPGRPSWCYGTPGIARALQSAALATGDAGLRQTAERALAACLADQAQLGQLTDASLCHGWAGLLHAARCAATDATDPARFDLARLDRELRRFLRVHGMPRQEGLLTGSTGIRLVTGPAGCRAPPASAWDQCLLTGTTPVGADANANLRSR